MGTNAVRRCFLWVVVLAVVLAGGAGAGTGASGPYEGRIEPVILSAANLPLLHGLPASSLYVYAYQEGAFRQIPSQVDRLMDGLYMPAGTGFLGPTDELVFMAADLGTAAPAGQITTALPIGATWYQVEVQDGVVPSLKGWAYIVSSQTLTRTTTSYVSFDPATRRINSSAYALGLAVAHPGFDYLALNGSGVNILDRTKIRVQTFFGTLTENDLGSIPDVVLVNGPVRSIVRGGAVIGYRAVIQSILSYTIPAGVNSIRLSTDFNAAATGSRFYNAQVSAGVIIDGVPDTLPPSPLSTWWQVSGSTGTLVQVSDMSRVSGMPSNYYKDNATMDPADTGDQRSYGDVGVQVALPSGNVTYSMVWGVLGPNRPNMGETVAAYVAHPFQLTVAVQGMDKPYRAHVPVVSR